MFEDAEHLLLQRVLGNAVMMIESRLSRPTYIKGGSDVSACPVEYLHDLVPVCHLLEVHLLHWRAGDNHSVVLFAAHLLEVRVERPHVFDGRILRSVALYLHERDFHLERGVGEQAHEVCLGSNLQRHQVQNDDTQRADVLLRGA